MVTVLLVLLVRRFGVGDPLSFSSLVLKRQGRSEMPSRETNAGLDRSRTWLNGLDKFVPSPSPNAGSSSTFNKIDVKQQLSAQF